jgi:pyruvate kinase
MKILATIGPVSQNLESIKKINNYTNLFRLNGSHNSLLWHKKISRLIKSINANNKILFDIPGIKPRTNNINNISIKNGDLVVFYFKKNFISKKKFIEVPLTNPIPNIRSTVKNFSISDGLYSFKIISIKKNILVGKSYQDFLLKPKKGVNIPNSYYDNKKQSSLYLRFLSKAKGVKFDAIGLSYVQNDKIVNVIKKKFPNNLILSKIENSEGLKNIEKVCQASDIIMIDRGDLSAEVGDVKLYDSILEISNVCTKNGKPLIIATENLDSMIHNSLPTKSEIMSLAFSQKLNVDEIMLSDETATSKNYLRIIHWLHNFINKYRILRVSEEYSADLFWKNLKNFNNGTLVIFSKKGYFLEKIIENNKFFNFIVFSCSKKIIDACNFRANCLAVKTKNFPRKMENFIYKNIKKNLNIVFKNNKTALLVFTNFPKKNSRANTMSLLDKDTFLKNN